MGTTIKEVFKFYNDYVKPIYSRIEAKNNTLPGELLFEIHSAFDHIKRIYIDGKDETDCCDKAINHLKRGALDAFKLDLKYFNEEYSKIITSNADLSIIDSGTFLGNLLNDRSEIDKLAENARIFVSKVDIEESFDNWAAVSIKIIEFRKKYFQMGKIKWAEGIAKRTLNKKFKHGIITGIIGSIIAYIIITFIKSCIIITSFLK